MLQQETIDRAICGEESALNEVIKHYKRYIAKVATEEIVYEDGRTEFAVNKELEGEIITHLLLAIIRLGEKHGKNPT